MPFAFWIFHGRRLMTLVYGIVRREPVIIFGRGRHDHLRAQHRG